MPRSAFPLGSGSGSSGGNGVGQGFAVSNTGTDTAKPAQAQATPEAVGLVGVAVVAVADELSELLAGLNMTKYRAKFDSKKVGGSLVVVWGGRVSGGWRHLGRGRTGTGRGGERGEACCVRSASACVWRRLCFL